jgi:uncharacterized RDD family membrane protein YckC
MINNYYIIESGERAGPFSHIELMENGLPPQALILSPISNEWQRAVRLPEFSAYFESQGIYYPSKVNLANFWWRLLAYFIDYVLLITFMAMIGVLLGLISVYTGNHWFDSDKEYKFEENLLGIVVFILYHSISESTRIQGSIGKVVCKLKVVNTEGERIDYPKAIGRNLGKILSSLMCGMGFLNIFWDKNRQAWHDQLAKTYIIRVS